MKSALIGRIGVHAIVLAYGLQFSALPANCAPANGNLVKPQPIVKSEDSAKIATAKEFLILFHPRTDPAYTAKLLDKIIPRMTASAKEDNPKLDVKKFEAENRSKIMQAAVAKLDQQARAVSRHFTLNELKELVAFNRSPIGRKLAEETPKIQAELLAENRLAKAKDRLRLKRQGRVYEQ